MIAIATAGSERAKPRLHVANYDLVQDAHDIFDEQSNPQIGYCGSPFLNFVLLGFVY